MLFQSDYCFRRTSGVNPHCEHRKDITDVIFTRYIRLNGPYQLFLDCSRVAQVSPENFIQLSLCKNLQYLDVSFTDIQDLSIIANNLLELRALNLAGLNVMTWDPLKSLTNLESLSLRFSQRVTNDAVDPIKHFLRLRSLNLGHTNVSDISFCKSLTRLEELVMDSSKLQLQSTWHHPHEDDNGEKNHHFIAIFSSMPALKVLNICETPL